MKVRTLLSMMLAGLIAMASAPAGAQEKPKVAIPNAGVPEIMTIEGTFVRAAYNNEGYVIVGYETSNRSVGDPWMLLDVGMTVLDRTPNYTLRREALSLTTPDGATIELPSIEEHRKADTRAIQTAPVCSVTRSTTSRRAPAGPAASSSSRISRHVRCLATTPN
jgi:hypothetical protein